MFVLDRHVDPDGTSLKDKLTTVSVDDVRRIFGEPHYVDNYSIEWCFRDTQNGRPYVVYDHDKTGCVTGRNVRIGSLGVINDDVARRQVVQFKGWLLHKLRLIDRMTALVKYGTVVT